MHPRAHEAVERAALHWQEAFGLAFVLTRDRGRAEELVQEGLVRIAGMGARVDVAKPIRGLILTIVRNLALNDRRRAAPESLDAGGVPHDPAADDPVDALLKKERREQLTAALERLPPTWREMVFLRDGLGLAYREIAELIGTSDDVVRTTLHRARTRVREMLESRVLSEDRS